MIWSAGRRWGRYLLRRETVGQRGGGSLCVGRRDSTSLALYRETCWLVCGWIVWLGPCIAARVVKRTRARVSHGVETKLLLRRRRWEGEFLRVVRARGRNGRRPLISRRALRRPTSARGSRRSAGCRYITVLPVVRSLWFSIALHTISRIPIHCS